MATTSIAGASFSRDEKHILFSSNESGIFNVYMQPVAGGKPVALTKSTTDSTYAVGYFCTDDRFLFVRDKSGDEQNRLFVRELDGSEKDLTPGDKLKASFAGWSNDGAAFYVLTNERNPKYFDLYRYDAKSYARTLLYKNEDGMTPGRISRDERWIALEKPNTTSDSDIYLYDLSKKELKHISKHEGTASYGAATFGLAAGAKAPAMIFVHGGPGGQTRRGYNALMQYLANHGYAVLGINNRGSSGYGKSFNTADDRKHGREPLWDCIEAKTFLASLGHIDPDRIGIMGGSYGGYMTLAAMAYRPEAFKVGIDIFGVSNWIRTLESIPPYWEAQRKALYEEIGDPVKDKEFLTATSPLFHAKEIRRPLMVIQGKNDPRVIKPESDEVVAAVQKNNVPVEYVVFDDEGHGFSKKKNQIVANAKMLEFLDKHLKPGLAAAKP